MHGHKRRESRLLLAEGTSLDPTKVAMPAKRSGGVETYVKDKKAESRTNPVLVHAHVLYLVMSHDACKHGKLAASTSRALISRLCWTGCGPCPQGETRQVCQGLGTNSKTNICSLQARP